MSVSVMSSPRFAVALLVVAMIPWLYMSLQLIKSSVGISSTDHGDGGAAATLRVPLDVKWYLPDHEGWLCDYEYIRMEDNSLALKIAPRNTGLGKIMVYSATLANPNGMRRNLFWSGVNQFYARWSPKESLMVDGKWTVIAMDHWGNLNRVFATTAKFGDSTAFVGVPSTFTIGQVIPLGKKDVQLNRASDRFPGLVGVDETVHAYG